MSRNYFRTVRCHGRVNQEQVQLNIIRTPVRYYDQCSLLRTSGVIQCNRFVIIVCDSLGEIVRIIHKVILRLKQVSNLLFHWNPASVIIREPLPDLLKDFNIAMLNKNRIEPDVIPDISRKSSIFVNRRRRRIDHPAVFHSSEDQMTDLYKCRNLTHSCQRHTITNSLQCCNNIPDSTSNNIGRQQHNNDSTSHRNNFYFHYRYARQHVYDNVESSDNIRVFDTENDRLPVIRESGQATSPELLSFHESASCQRYLNILRDLSNHRHGNSRWLGSRYQNTFNNAQTIEDNVPFYRVNAQRGQESQEFDREIAKDIGRTLRTIGDDLDAKMRHNHRPYPQAALDATERFLQMTMRQNNLVGVAVDASLALLKFIRK